MTQINLVYGLSHQRVFCISEVEHCTARFGVRSSVEAQLFELLHACDKRMLSTTMFHFNELHFVSSLDRSPFYSHISTSLQGLTTIRAYRAENRFKNQYDVYQDNHTAAWFLFMTGSRWLGARLDFICTVFIASAAFSPLFLAEGGIRK